MELIVLYLEKKRKNTTLDSGFFIFFDKKEMLDKYSLLQELQALTSLEQLEARYQDILGKKGKLTEALKALASMTPEEKKSQGAILSSARTELQDAYQAKFEAFKIAEINQHLSQDLVDISLPGTALEQWHFSLLTKVRRELEDIAHGMWFIVEAGRDAVSKFENFEAENIPVSHPATEMHDTIYLTEKDERGENYVLRTHTSAAQNYVIKKYGVPVKAVLPGRVYRFENMDATHDTMFYQFEGIYIDKNVSIGHFKTVIKDFLSAALKKEVEIRMRPAYFPFVEPGFEIDARYEYLNPKTWQKEMSKRVEILGAGMIHPQVLREAGVNPDEWWTGFAFGMGVNRLAAARYGIKDIRLFTNGDLRFAKSW